MRQAVNTITRTLRILSMTGVGLVYMFLLVITLSSVAAIEGQLTPENSIIEVGSNLILNCTIASSNGSRTAQDVIWQHGSVQLSPSAYMSLSDTMSQLTLTNVTFDMTGVYYCLFPGDELYEKLGTLVRVGNKPDPPLLQCFIRNPDEYWCRWEKAASTNLRTQSKFSFWFNGNWTDCPPDGEIKGPNTCFISIYYNTGTKQTVRVTSSNALGEAEAEKSFNPSADVVVNPPRRVILSQGELEISLSVTWNIPNEWNRISTPLDYKLRFKRNDCSMMNDTCCCWTEITMLNRNLQDLSYTLRDLAPYTIYVVQMAARYGLDEKNWSEWTKEESSLSADTLPSAGVQNLEIIDEENTASTYLRNVRIHWQTVPQEHINGELIGYDIHIKADDGQSDSMQEMITIGPNSNWYKVEGLQKFQGYTIKVAARNGAGLGPWAQEHVRDLTTTPNAPDDVRAVALTTTSILVSWDTPSQPNGYIEDYTVEWRKANGAKHPYTTPDARLNHTIDDLETFVLYEVSVKARNSRGESGYRSVRGGIRTLEGVPDAPPTDVEVEPVQDQPNRLMLMWKRPPAEHINGNLTGYRISLCQSSPYYHENTGKLCSGDLLVQNVSRPDAISETLTNLVPSTSYSIWLAAYTAIGVGPDSELVHGKTAQETQGILLLAIFVPLVILIIIPILAIYFWKSCHHIFEPAPEPKFTKEVDLWKKESQRISRSSSRVEEEHFDNILPAQTDDIIISLLDNSIELAKEASQTSPNLDLNLESVHLYPKTQTAKFIRSESRDSGVPPSPASESPDFSTLRDRQSISEEDDNVFLEDEDTITPSSQSFSPYTLVGQFTPSNKHSPESSQSSPVKSPKKVSFEIPSVNKFSSTLPNDKQSSVDQNASHSKQTSSRSSKRSSSASSVDVSPYMQMSAMESLQLLQQQTHQSNPQHQSLCPASTQNKVSHSLASVVSPYTQMSAMASLPHKKQENHQEAMQLPSQSPAVESYTQMPAMTRLQLPQQQKPESEQQHLSGGLNTNLLTPPISSPYTQLSALASLQPNPCQQLKQQPNSPDSPPAVSPYIKASILESPKPNQEEANKPKLQSTQRDPSPPGSTTAQQASQPPPPNSSKSQDITSNSTKHQVVSPYTRMSELGAKKPRQSDPILTQARSPIKMSDVVTMIPRQDQTDSLTKSLTNSLSSQLLPPKVVSPYTMMSDVQATKPIQDQTSFTKSSSLSPHPIPLSAVSPNSQISESAQPNINTTATQQQNYLPSVKNSQSAPAGTALPTLSLHTQTSTLMFPKQPDQSDPNHQPPPRSPQYPNQTNSSSLNISPYVGMLDVDALLKSQQHASQTRPSSTPDGQQSLQPSALNAANTEVTGYWSVGASVPQNVLPSSEPNASKHSQEGQVNLQNIAPKVEIARVSTNPERRDEENEKSPRYVLAACSPVDHCRPKQPLPSLSLPIGFQPNPCNHSDSKLDGYLQMSPIFPRIPPGSDQPYVAKDPALNPKVTAYTHIHQNEELPLPPALTHEHVPSSPIDDSAVSGSSQIADPHNASQEDQSTHAMPKSQDGPSEGSGSDADTLVPGGRSLKNQAAVDTVLSLVDNQSEMSSDRDGFDNETDNQSDNTPSHSHVSDYVQAGAGALGSVGNTPPHSHVSDYVQAGAGALGSVGNTPQHSHVSDYVQAGAGALDLVGNTPTVTVNPDAGNHVSPVQPLSDYIVAGHSTHPRTDGQN